MTLPVPAGVLPEAHRVCCLRCLRRIALGKEVEVVCEWTPTKSKCTHCVNKHEKCLPVSVGPGVLSGLFY